MVVLRSCSNRCVRGVITMADLSVGDRSSVTPNMPRAVFCVWISLCE